MDSSYTLPKKYLSYSAIHLWHKDKEAFRARYYRNEKSPDTVFSLFGREVHKKLETNDELKHIPRFSVAELPISVTVEGIPLLGYIDGFAPRKKSFLDYKTGIRNTDGKPRWNEVEVQKLEQLPFYSMLIEEKYGTVHPKCKLIWLETAWKEEPQQIGSQTLMGEGKELELTGYFEVFNREIEPWERDRIKKWVVQSAEAISEDFKSFRQ